MDKKKNILILGGFGFIGTNVLKYIDQYFSRLYQCIVFDRIPEHPYGVSISCVQKSYAGDFTDSQLLERIFAENTIDIVIHSLSTTIPIDSQNARYDVESNLLPTLDVLHYMVMYGVKNIVYLSSGGSVYGNNLAKHTEQDNVSPISSYGVVKLAIEKYILQHSQLYGIQPLIVRLSNPYGPFHYSSKQGVVNIAIRKSIRRETLQVWGNGDTKKDYIYIKDFIQILFQLLQKEQFCGVINIGSGTLLSVNQIIQEINNHSIPLHVEYTEAKQLDVKDFELELSKLYSLLGDFQFTNFNEGIKETILWTKQICD